MSEVGQIDADAPMQGLSRRLRSRRTRLTPALSAGHGRWVDRMKNFTRGTVRTGDPTRTALIRDVPAVERGRQEKGTSTPEHNGGGRGGR